MRSNYSTCAVLLSLASLLLPAAASAGQYYANGNNINLASGRSNTYSSSTPQPGFAGNLLAPLYPSYPVIEYRVENDLGTGPYWQVNFPQPYSVSSAYLETYPNPCCQVTAFEVQTTTNGITWTTQGSGSVAPGNYSLNATFPAVSGVTGVRLVNTAWANNSYPGIMRCADYRPQHFVAGQ